MENQLMRLMAQSALQELPVEKRFTLTDGVLKVVPEMKQELRPAERWITAAKKKAIWSLYISDLVFEFDRL